MTGVDVALAFTLGAFAVRGYWRGFFRESFGLLAIIAGVAGALQFTPLGVVLLQERLPLPPAAQTGVVFVGIFVVAHAVVTLIGVVLDRLAGTSRLRGINHLAGALLGIAKGGVLLAVVLLFLHLLPVVPKADAHIMGSAVARSLVAAASDVLQRGGHGAPPESPSRT